MAVPHTAPMATVAAPMAKVVPAPFMIRLRMSRPKLSVPSRCCQEGGSNLGPTEMAVGS